MFLAKLKPGEKRLKVYNCVWKPPLLIQLEEVVDLVVVLFSNIAKSQEEEDYVLYRVSLHINLLGATRIAESVTRWKLKEIQITSIYIYIFIDSKTYARSGVRHSLLSTVG